ncbi:MAG: methylamine utilization protein [Elusimicrobia bacterium]|nr:methylamine utilization protein [Elusimicrobiota bacterium]
MRALLLAALAALPVRAGVIEAVVRDAEGKPLADAVVFLRKAADLKEAPPLPQAEMSQLNQELDPHLVVVPAGGTVQFPNKDTTHHHLYSFSKPKSFDLPLYKGDDAPSVKFEKPGVVKVGCNIHDWMSGIVFVAPTPYYGRTGADGSAVLTVPDGKVEVSVFHERLKGSVDDTTRRGEAGKAPLRLSWTLTLKKNPASKRPATGYK